MSGLWPHCTDILTDVQHLFPCLESEVGCIAVNGYLCRAASDSNPGTESFRHFPSRQHFTGVCHTVVSNVRRTLFVRQKWNTPRKAGLVFSSRHPMSTWTLPRAFSISQHHGCCHLCISQHHRYSQYHRYGHLRIL